MNIPRVLIAAPKSGSGKTLLTCALLEALQKRKRKPVSFKCGPDYIDPMFHRTVLGIPSENLDTWFAGEDGVKEVMAESLQSNGGEIAVMEGVMGLFDGLGGTKEEGSAYHLAKVTGTPILLVMDVHGMGRTMAALLAGILSWDREKLIKGIILNRISSGYYAVMKPLLEEELGVPVLGYFPTRKDQSLTSRHLGLMLPEEIDGIKEQLKRAAEQLEETVDVNEILAIAGKAEDLKLPGISAAPEESRMLTLGVARDEAFCFYYPANLREFEKRGVCIREFSLLKDGTLPEEVDGILLGGGYPELYGKELAENQSMKDSIRNAIAEGLPSLAECGGFMYLHRQITDEKQQSFPMCGIIDADVTWQGKLVRFGYGEFEEKDACFLRPGQKIKGHEFHYYDSSDNGASCTGSKPTTGRTWDCMMEGKNHLWGFPHLYYPSAPELADAFVLQMRNYHEKRKDLKNEFRESE